MARHSTAPGSKRRHGDVRRTLRLTIWYTGDELEAVRAEAARHGLAPAAYLAKLGTDTAAAVAAGRAGTPAAAPDVIAAISDAASLARRLGYLLNQPVARLNATGEHSPDLEASAAAVARAVTRMEAAVMRAARALRPAR